MQSPPLCARASGEEELEEEKDEMRKMSWTFSGERTGIIVFCVGRDCRLKYNFNFEDMSVAFSDSPTFCDQYDTFFIQIRSVEAELRAVKIGSVRIFSDT